MNLSTQSISRDFPVLTEPAARGMNGDAADEGADEFSKTFDLEIEYLEVAIDDPILHIAAEQGNELPQDGNLIPAQDEVLDLMPGTEIASTPTLVGMDVEAAVTEPLETEPLETDAIELADSDRITDAGIGFVAPGVERAVTDTIAEKPVQSSFSFSRVTPNVAEADGRQGQESASTLESVTSSSKPKLKALWQMQVLANDAQPKNELLSQQLTGELTRPVINQGVVAVDPAQIRLPGNASNLDGLKSSSVIPVRVGEPGWGESMVNRITLLVGQRISSAQVHLNPPELGPVEIRVSLNKDQASVLFVSQSAQVRDALTQSIPRLSELLGQMGIDLAESNVSDQSFSQHQPDSDETNRLAESAEEQPHYDAETMTGTHRLIGLIDFYV